MCQFHNQLYDLDNNITKRTEDSDQRFCFCPRQIHNTNSNQNSDKYHLEHLRVIGCSCKKVLGNHIHKEIERTSLQKTRRCSRRSEEHTSELQSRGHLVCRLLLEKKKKTTA